MEEYYVHEVNIIEKTEPEKEEELIQNILKTSRELKIANKNFAYAQDELIDYYAYQIKANQSKLDYLIKLAKHKGISVDILKKEEYPLLEANNEAV